MSECVLPDSAREPDPSLSLSSSPLCVSSASIFPSHCSAPSVPARLLVSGSFLREGDQTSHMAADLPGVNALRDKTWHLFLPCVSKRNVKFSRVNTSSPALEASVTKLPIACAVARTKHASGDKCGS